MAPGPKPRTYDRFTVTQIEYTENRRIKTLGIRNEATGNDVFFWTSDTKLPVMPEPAGPVCELCGKPVEAYKSEGKLVTISQHTARCKRRFGRTFCKDCAVKLAEAQEKRDIPVNPLNADLFSYDSEQMP